MISEHYRHKCFIIHLQRAVKRKNNVQSIISNLNLETEVINAIDGNKLTSNEISKYLSKKNLYKPYYPFRINNGEIGCFLSHRAVWKKIVEEKLDSALILEDDAQIDFENFGKSFKIGLKYINQLGYIQFQTREIPNNLVELCHVNGIKIFQPKIVPLRTSAQLISYKTALKLLEKSTQIDRPVDGFLQLFWSTNQNISCIKPSGIKDITQISGGSTLSMRQSIFSSIGRTLKRFYYRLKIKIYSEIFKDILIKDTS